MGPGRRKLEGGKYRTAGEEKSAEGEKEKVKVIGRLPPIVGSCRRSRHRSFCSRRGAVEVRTNDDYDDDYDEHGEERYVTLLLLLLLFR